MRQRPLLSGGEIFPLAVATAVPLGGHFVNLPFASRQGAPASATVPSSAMVVKAISSFFIAILSLVGSSMMSLSCDDARKREAPIPITALDR